MTDNDIISLYFERNEAAIIESERKYGAYLSKIAYNILLSTEDTKEAVNDTYFKAWSIIPPNKPGRLSAFLAKLTRNISIDKYRNKHSLKRIDNQYAVALDELSDIISDNMPSPEEEAEYKLIAEILNDFIITLSEKNRNIFVCRYFFFDSLKDISGYYEISEANVKTILFRLREKLRERLLREGFSL